MGERAPNYGKHTAKIGFCFTRHVNVKGVTGFWNKLQNRNWYNKILVLCCWGWDRKQNRANESNCNTYMAHQFFAHSWVLPDGWSGLMADGPTAIPVSTLLSPTNSFASTPNTASSSPLVLAYRAQGGPFFPSAWWGSLPGWGWPGKATFRIVMAQLVCPFL